MAALLLLKVWRRLGSSGIAAGVVGEEIDDQDLGDATQEMEMREALRQSHEEAGMWPMEVDRD
eukprot:7605539-Prorocentrum_lima.AAC.1